MTDVVYVALITAAGVLLGALTTQFLSIRASAQLAARTAQQELLQWQRSELKRRTEAREARFREFWELVLVAQSAMIAQLESARDGTTRPHESFSESPAGQLAKAYTGAFLGLGELRAPAKLLYRSTADAQLAIDERNHVDLDKALTTWRSDFDALEAAAIKFAEKYF